MTTPSKVTVALKSNSYDILIGDNLLEVAGEVLRERFGSRRIFIVTEDRVAGLYLDRLRHSLFAAHYAISEIIVPGGEGSKEFHVLQGLIEDLLEAGVARDSLIIAFGEVSLGTLLGLLLAYFFAASTMFKYPLPYWLRLIVQWAEKQASILRSERILLAVFISRSWSFLIPHYSTVCRSVNFWPDMQRW